MKKVKSFKICSILVALLVSLSIFSTGLTASAAGAPGQPQTYTYGYRASVGSSLVANPKVLMTVVFNTGSTTALTCEAKTLLRTGSTGTGVKMLQAGLNRVMNSGLAVDGIFGSATSTQLYYFQKKYLGASQADRICGIQTWRALARQIESLYAYEC